MSINKKFSFLESVVKVPFDFFKDTFFDGKDSKESTVGFLGRTLGDAITAVADGDEKSLRDIKVIDSASTLTKNLPSTTPAITQGSPFRFTDTRLNTALRKLTNQSNNKELLNVIARANYTPQAVRPSRPNIKMSPTKFGV
jgi:hypothetical protein